LLGSHRVSSVQRESWSVTRLTGTSNKS
jgi:hypothetical protein